MDILHPFKPRNLRNIYIALTASYITYHFLSRLYTALTYTGHSPPPRILRAPPSNQQAYPPDSLPGGRDISTPYGNLRAYEFGPATATRKILFVHGISTPGIVLSRIALRLAEKEDCRVLVFDLFGRGYSDCPASIPHDMALFSYQLLACISTSEIDWTSTGFTICGYSLGGGIAVDFAYYFPEMVRGLVLICPGGLMRTQKIDWRSKLLFSGLLPDWAVHCWIRRTLRGSSSNTKKTIYTDAATEELPATTPDSCSPIFDDRPHITPANAVAWQVERHEGFVEGFVSCVRFAPIHDGWEKWRVVGGRCAAGRKEGGISEAKEGGLREGKVLVLLGEQDVVVPSTETAEDAEAAFGRENVRVVKLRGGHDLPVTNSEGCVNAMVEFWNGIS